MTHEKLSPEEAEHEFWQHLKHGQSVMLGVDVAGHHTQPMTAFAEPESNLVWFFTRDDLDLVKEVAANGDGKFVLVSKDEKIYADIRGTLSISRDKLRIDKYWNPMVAAWYPEGKDDPQLTLLRFVPDEGQLWVSKQGLIRLAFQMAKAKLSKTMPNVGGVADVNFKH